MWHLLKPSAQCHKLKHIDIKQNGQTSSMRTFFSLNTFILVCTTKRKIWFWSIWFISMQCVLAIISKYTNFNHYWFADPLTRISKCILPPASYVYLHTACIHSQFNYWWQSTFTSLIKGLTCTSNPQISTTDTKVNYVCLCIYTHTYTQIIHQAASWTTSVKKASVEALASS